MAVSGLAAFVLFARRYSSTSSSRWNLKALPQGFSCVPKQRYCQSRKDSSSGGSTMFIFPHTGHSVRTKAGIQ